MFSISRSESPESEEGGAPFSSPLTGTPPAMPETSFGSTPQGYFLADVEIAFTGARTQTMSASDTLPQAHGDGSFFCRSSLHRRAARNNHESTNQTLDQI